MIIILRSQSPKRYFTICGFRFLFVQEKLLLRANNKRSVFNQNTLTTNSQNSTYNKLKTSVHHCTLIITCLVT